MCSRIRPTNSQYIYIHHDAFPVNSSSWESAIKAIVRRTREGLIGTGVATSNGLRTQNVIGIDRWRD